MIKCLYHKPDLDGHCSGALVRYLIEHNLTKQDFAPEVEARPIGYEDIFPFDELAADDTVILVDFSLPYDDMVKLEKSVKRLIWIDHHKSSIEELEGLNYEGVRSTDKAACQLVLDYFAKPEVASKHWTFVEWLGLYDSWKWEQHPDAQNIFAFQYGMRINHTDPADNFPFWNVLFKAALNDEATSRLFITRTTETGKNIIKYQKQFDKDYIKHYGFETAFEDYSTFAVNRDRGGLQSFGELINKYDICLTYVYNGSKYVVSLYSSKIDVSVAAKIYGGGGHPGASGFEKDWMEVTEDNAIHFYNKGD